MERTVGATFGDGKNGGELHFDWVEIRRQSVLFVTQEFGNTHSPMVAKDFRLPFPAMIIKARKGVHLEDKIVHTLWLIEMEIFDGVRQWRFRSPDFGHAVTFRVLESGELEVKSVDQSDKEIAGKTLSEISLQQREKIISNATAEKWVYNFVYDVMATIDSINHSEYVVTTHTTKHESGARLSRGGVERRIKIKHTHSISEATGRGTKHRYKYRVRGHWRHQSDDKKTWIRDHVRGGDGTIFISKEYEI